MKSLLLKTIAFTGLFLVAHPMAAQNWTLREVPEEDNQPSGNGWQFHCVASSADGTKLVAGAGGGPGPIFTSRDSGATWQMTSAASMYWNSVASSADGTILVAVGTSLTEDAIYTSYDSGATWTQRASFFASWTGVASSSDGTKLVAVALSDGSPAHAGIWHSSDSGATWQMAVTHHNPTNGWTAVASSADGTRLVAVGASFITATTFIYLSSDSGATWGPVHVPNANWTSVASSANGSKLVAVANYPGTLYTSTDSGATWSRQAGAPPENWLTVASSADGTRLVAGGGSINVGQIYTSFDSGVTWLSTNNAPTLPSIPPHNLGWLAAASSADGTRLVALPFGTLDIYTLQFPTTPLTTLSVTATPPRVHTGDQIQVVVTALNDDTNTLTNVQLAGPISTAGSGQVSLLSGPSPAVIASVPPGQTVTFTNIYIGTNYGQVIFTATTTGTGPKGTVIGSTASSGTVNIVPNGDLLIKRAVESADLYAGLGVFYTVPIPPQVKTNIVSSTNDVSTFQVQIQNNDPQPQTFTLQAKESGNPVWKRAFLLSGADVTAQLEVPGGMTLPAMPPGTALTLTVTLQDTNASVSDLNSAEFILGLASDITVTLDAVQAFTQLVPVILVNSTADLPLLDPNGCCCDTGRKLAGTNVAECTLRAAIQLANRNPLKDIIKFQIPANDPGVIKGVPSIQPQTALPDVTDSVVIDGWSQSPASSSPPVELSGKAMSPRAPYGQLCHHGVLDDTEYLLLSGIPSGLHVVAAGCEIRGLVVNLFPMCGILVDGSGAIIQGNYLGTDPSGTISEPSGLTLIENESRGFDPAPHYLQGGGGAQVFLQSAGNMVGGSEPNSGNVISGGPNQIHSDGDTIVGWVGTPGLVIRGGGANGNVVEGNIIGLDASASHTPFIPPGGHLAGITQGRGQYIGVWIVDGSGNRVGSSTAGAGNIIAGNVRGVYITGASAVGNVIAGNQIGWSPRYSGDFHDQRAGVHLATGARQNTVGGSGADDGNIIGDTGVGISDDGASNVIQGNWIGVLSYGKTAIPARYGIFVTEATSPQIANNTIANIANIGIWLDSSPSCRVFGNRISACDDHGIQLTGPSQGTVITLNTIFGNGLEPGRHFGSGVYLARNLGESGAVTISQNSIYNSDGLGIGFNADSTPVLDRDGGQPIRMIFNDPPPVYGNGQIQIIGRVQASVSSGTYLVEFFGNDSGNRSGYGEGQTFLGSAAVAIGVLGTGSINVTFPCPNDPGKFLTATATAPDGSTTEFSKAYLIQPCLPGIKGICPGIETNVPNLVGHSGQIRPRGLSFGDGNGDGIPDWLQSNVASLPSLPGLWVTLAAPNGTVLENVTPTAVPDYASLPAGYVFPIGFLSYGITNLPANGEVTITNFLHLDADPSFAYAAMTYFNFGPTPDNLTPHWYEFLFDSTTGAELLPDRIILHLRDGARGDHDVSINGEIVTLGAPAYQIPPTPQLAISLVSVGSSNIVDILAGTNDTFSLVTNPVTVVACVLSWPTNENNYVLEFQNDLSSQNLFAGLPALLWQTVPETRVIVNGWNFVTNTTIGSTGFYRLSPNAGVATASGPVLLSVQLTGTNAVLFSWPASASGFGLQQNSDLDATKWVNVTNAVGVVGGNYQVIASPVSGRQFYRLQAQ